MGFDVFQTVLVWAKVSKWRKTSKWKSLVKRVRHRLEIHKNRRSSIIKHSRADIAHLLQYGQLETALSQVEQLYKDQCLLSAYDQLDHFCRCIHTHLPHISNHSVLQNLPGEVSEAVSSLIYAASRCGELPELCLLRNLFKQHFGHEFIVANDELLHGNLVNSQIKEKLRIDLVPDDVKLDLMSKIARDYTLHLEPQDNRQHFQPLCQEVA